MSNEEKITDSPSTGPGGGKGDGVDDVDDSGDQAGEGRPSSVSMNGVEATFDVCTRETDVGGICRLLSHFTH